MNSSRPKRLAAAIAALVTMSTYSWAASPASNPLSSAFAVPRVISPLAEDPALEARINEILAKLSLEQKIGQMIQPHIGAVTPEEVKRYNIGSVLNGGGQTPNNNPDAGTQDWVKMAEQFYQASMSTEGGRTPIPVIWGIDAVHGHTNLIGATLFPHNIALGAANNPELTRALGALTASEVAASGQDWDFAPTLAVAQDDRWGRTYESFSEDPALVASLGGKMVEGLQGTAKTPSFLDHQHVVATAKHFIGDGGTQLGDDQGFTQGDEQQLLYTHLPGYIAALNAGVQTVMASYSWWNGTHAHANKHLMTDLLKGQLGFDGFIVSDWMAIGHVPGCTLDNCAQAVNAGVDMFMIPNAPDWKNFLANVTAQVKSGEIPQVRIDDAVRRILRVKLRAGLWQKPSPAARAASAAGVIGSSAHRELARQAVRESLVLLKNEGAVLPIAPKARVLVTGPGADNLSLQAGGWSVTWQGADLPNSKFPGATSIYKGLTQALAATGGKAELSEKGDFKTKPDLAVVVFGERPYAEMHGDIQHLSTLEVEQETKTTLALIKKLKAKKIPVVAVLLSGRPLWVNKELNAADAFVAAWQPGTEGQGVADVLVAQANGKPRYDFTGRLSFSWPKTPCQTPLNKGDKPYDPLFPFNFGLTYETASPWQTLGEDTNAFKYGCILGDKIPAVAKTEFPTTDGWHWRVEEITLTGKTVSQPVTQGPISGEPTAEGGAKASWSGQGAARLLLRTEPKRYLDFLPMYASQGAAVVDVKLGTLPSATTKFHISAGQLTFSEVDITAALNKFPLNTWQTLSVDLKCFTKDRLDVHKVDSPVGIQTAGALQLELRNPRYEPGLAKAASVSCQ